MRNIWLALLGLALTPSAWAVGGYTAIAYDAVSGYGSQSNDGQGWFTVDDAEAHALQKCQAHTQGNAADCQVIGSTYSGYIALYRSVQDRKVYGLGTGDDRASAESAAYDNCNNSLVTVGDSCVEVVYGFSFP